MEKRLLSPTPSRAITTNWTRSQNSRDAHKKPDDPRMNEVLGVKNPNTGRTPRRVIRTRASHPTHRRWMPRTATIRQTAKTANSPTAARTPSRQATINQLRWARRRPAASPNPDRSKGSSPQSSPGLLDKMKDAMSSLVSKMRRRLHRRHRRIPANSRITAMTKTRAPARRAIRHSQAKQGANNQQNGQEANAQGEENSQTAERAQNAQGRNSDRSSDKNGNDAHSGVGRQDGAKELKEAQQQEAMGKLAEIIGKRSANLTGEVMVEVPNGKQQLQTKYSQKVGKHADMGGEINRDEVPLIYQQYVREYMEQVHKQAKTLK